MTFRVLNSFIRPKRCFKLLGGITAALLAVTASPAALAGDPFRSGNEHNIGPHTEDAFEAFFKEGDYVGVREALDLAINSEEANEPMIHSMAASIAYLDEDWDSLAEAASLTRSTAETLLETDPLRGHMYSAVGIFLEGAHLLSTQGVARSTPAALVMLQQVFGHIGEAEKIDSTDPELNLIKGFMDLMLAVNLPFSNPEEAIDRLTQYGSPSYVSYRGIALGYRDLGQIPEAMTAVKQALETASENPELHYLKAQLHRRQQETEDSVASFDKALEYATQLPPSLTRAIYKERCRTLGGSREICGQEATNFVKGLDKEDTCSTIDGENCVVDTPSVESQDADNSVEAVE